MKKKIFAMVVLVIAMCICIYNKPTSAGANFMYKYDTDGNIVITAYKGTASAVTIPNTIDGKKVVKIGEHAFDESRNDTNGKVLEKVVVSEGITTIGDFAFIGCVNLQAIKLPSTLTYLGDQTFIGCSNLKKINIPSKVTSFRTYVFQETGLESFVIPSNIRNIGSGTFRICKSLKKVVVYSKNLVYIDDSIFEHCSESMIIYGYSGSTTQTYAQKHRLKFVPLSNKTTTTKNKKNIVSVKSVAINKSEIKLDIGQKTKLVAVITPKNATNKKVKWKSSNEKVVVVNNGIIMAKGAGEAYIGVATYDGIKKAYCKVTVGKKTSIKSDEKLPGNSNDKNSKENGKENSKGDESEKENVHLPGGPNEDNKDVKTKEEDNNSADKKNEQNSKIEKTNTSSLVTVIIVAIAVVIIMTVIIIVAVKKVKVKDEN